MSDSKSQSIFINNTGNKVGRILSTARGGDYSSNLAKQAKVKELESQIDQMVYELYGLTRRRLGGGE